MAASLPMALQLQLRRMSIATYVRGTPLVTCLPSLRNWPLTSRLRAGVLERGSTRTLGDPETGMESDEQLIRDVIARWHGATAVSDVGS